MNYLLLLASFIVFAGVICAIRFLKPSKEKLVIERILVFIAMGVFIARFMCYLDVQVQDATWSAYQHLGPGNKVLNVFGELAIWLIVPANIMLLMRPFSTTNTSKWYVKFITLPIIVCTIGFMYPMINLMQGSYHTSFGQFTVLEYLLPIELGMTLALNIYYLLKDWKTKITKMERIEAGLLSSVGMLFAIPPFLPMFFFGKGTQIAKGLNFDHRLTLYILAFALPFIIYFVCRNLPKNKIRYILIFISLGVMFNFVYFNKYDVFLEPWRLPFHLCNTAVFILPICYIFMPKRLFYFTYFINVFGAFLAMLMPNTGDLSTIFEPGVVRFWYNHMCAFWMPILGVALHLFERPKMKQYFYSAIWFLVYYVLAMVLNTIFTGLGHKTDFFFINSNYVADKLGGWANNIFFGKFEFKIAGINFVVRPLYQSLYFIVYLLIGFAVWFVYQLGYDISDSHYQLHIKLKGIKQDKIALESVLNGRSIEEPMDENAGIKLELQHFSKKYGLNKHYSVHDVSFEVHAGEVFGFLGPNGAGKSTIIKSIVGIQPITEGKMLVCGYDVQSQSVYAKQNIGFVPDHYALYEKLTGREYINYIADIFDVSDKDRNERMDKYVKLFELEQSIDNKIKTYSHGMKQKITIISALIHNPKIWILDEPLTGLDPTSIFQVKECMKRHAEEGNIVFFSSHLIDIVEKLCDRVGIIKHGELQVVDSVENIEKSGKSLEQFYLDIIGDNVTKAGH